VHLAGECRLQLTGRLLGLQRAAPLALHVQISLHHWAILQQPAIQTTDGATPAQLFHAMLGGKNP
jgi:hypothetical protein